MTVEPITFESIAYESIAYEPIASQGLFDNVEINAPQRINNPDETSGITFGQLLEAGIGEVNNSLNAADAQLQKLALNQPVSTHELMISIEKAKMQLQLGVEVSNRLVEGYQQIMRMQL